MKTICKCIARENNINRSKVITDLALMHEWSQYIDAGTPSAFIFHVFRCGSTLVSQALGIKEGAVSLSEVPLFDELLRLPLNNNLVSLEQSNGLLYAALRFYGAKRTGREQHLFVKLDSWHLMFYERIRQLYSDVPFIIIYRTPAEVLESNSRKKGIQGLADIITPDVYGFYPGSKSFIILAII